jgi:hypothetical protein
MIQPITIVQSDYGYQIPFTLEDGNGTAVNLSGATLALKVQSAQDPSATLALTGSMTIDVAASGTCHYTVASGDFPNPGTFLIQITATYSTEVLSWSGLQIVVVPSLPKSIN